MMRCPNCNSRDIGKIGSNQFYCWECFVEFNVVGDQVKLFQVEEDGSLSSFDDLFSEIPQVGTV
ncbi:hypothetical protein [Effusibacillus dendaii]|uniref:hypothetical protein n=1 Tax=Effusibacillus dendaii TaxID=2743772 RepID=UPI001CF77493|nr:hypothetical protein [Effusibacillus dendaii]